MTPTKRSTKGYWAFKIILGNSSYATPFIILQHPKQKSTQGNLQFNLTQGNSPSNIMKYAQLPNGLNSANSFCSVTFIIRYKGRLYAVEPQIREFPVETWFANLANSIHNFILLFKYFVLETYTTWKSSPEHPVVEVSHWEFSNCIWHWADLNVRSISLVIISTNLNFGYFDLSFSRCH